MTEEKIHPKIEKILKEKGKEYIIAAMVYASLGYFSPKTAEGTLNWYLKGHKFGGCERCLALWKGDLEKMLLDDIAVFESISKEKQEKMIKMVKALLKRDLAENMTFSAMFPTEGAFI